MNTPKGRLWIRILKKAKWQRRVRSSRLRSAAALPHSPRRVSLGSLTIPQGNNPEYRFSDQPEGIVIDQNPGGGATVKKGDTVTLYVSKGTEKVQVPDLRNRTEEEAREQLEVNQLTIGHTDSSYHDTIEEGKIISQTPQPQSSVEKGSSVDFVVSLGKKEVFYQLPSKQIGVPENSDSVVSANIQLQDANGTVVDNWSGISISSFPYVISAKNITTSSGTILIEWILEDGETDTQTESVEFKEQK